MADEATSVPTVSTWTPPAWLNTFVKVALRTPGVQRLIGRSIALISVTGRKTGKRYTTPVTYDRRGDTVTVVTKKLRMWWRNLEAKPDVRLRLAGREYRGRARATIGDPESLPHLLAFLERNRQDARAYGITFTEDGRPDETQVKAILPDLVIITITLEEPRR